MNYGNTGHRGYKMSRVMSIEAKDGKVHAVLECGHTQDWEPGYGHTAESWAKHIQEGYRPFVVGQTRLRCEEAHEERQAEKRYKMATCTSIEPQNDHALIHLSCGHTERAYPYSTSLERLFELLQQRIGKRQRCYKCQVEMERRVGA